MIAGSSDNEWRQKRVNMLKLFIGLSWVLKEDRRERVRVFYSQGACGGDHKLTIPG